MVEHSSKETVSSIPYREVAEAILHPKARRNIKALTKQSQVGHIVLPTHDRSVGVTPQQYTDMVMSPLSEAVVEVMSRTGVQAYPVDAFFVGTFNKRPPVALYFKQKEELRLQDTVDKERLESLEVRSKEKITTKFLEEDPRMEKFLLERYLATVRHFSTTEGPYKEIFYSPFDLISRPSFSWTNFSNNGRAFVYKESDEEIGSAVSFSIYPNFPSPKAYDRLMITLASLPI